MRYRPRPDRNQELRQEIVTLAHRFRRYGAGMIYLKLRQAGKGVNHKRVERLYAEERLQIKRRKRKKRRGRDRDRHELQLQLTRVMQARLARLSRIGLAMPWANRLR